MVKRQLKTLKQTPRQESPGHDCEQTVKFTQSWPQISEKIFSKFADFQTDIGGVSKTGIKNLGESSEPDLNKKTV